MEKIWLRLKKKYPVLDRWERIAKIFTLPGFEGIPIYRIYRFFIAEIRNHSLATRSQSIAFSFFLAIFPALTFIFTLIPFLPYFRDMDNDILDFLNGVLPNQETFNFIKSFIQPLLKDLAHHRRGGLLTGSFLLVFFLTSNGVLAMMTSFNKPHEHYKRRTPLQNRWVALKITMLLILLFIVSFSLIVLGQDLINLMAPKMKIMSASTHLLLNMLRYIFSILMFFFAISLIYYYGPSTKEKYRFISTGATVATILSIIVSIAYSYYVSNFGKLNIIFGSIGTIMLLMIWLNINAFVLLIGYEINASIHYNTLNRKTSVA